MDPFDFHFILVDPTKTIQYLKTIFVDTFFKISFSLFIHKLVEVELFKMLEEEILPIIAINTSKAKFLNGVLVYYCQSPFYYFARVDPHQNLYGPAGGHMNPS